MSENQQSGKHEGAEPPAADAPRMLKMIGYTLAAIVLLRLLSLPFYPILDKTEARYAEIGMHMLQTGNWITPLIEPNVPYWGKPPLSMWLTALSYLAFGLNEFGARFSSFVIYGLLLYLTYRVGANERDRLFGLTAALVLSSMGLAFYLGGAVMTDPALTLGITLTMVGFWLGTRRADRAGSYLFFLGLPIALLAKGPIGVILPGLAIGAWIAWQRQWAATWRNLPWITGTCLVLVLALPWYYLAELKTPGFLRYFIIGEHFERYLVSNWRGDLYGSGRSLPLGTIWLLGFAATLPWPFVWVTALLNGEQRSLVFNRHLLRDPWLGYLIAWALAPFVFFTLARNTLLTYVAPAMPALALLTAHVLRNLQFDRFRLRIPLLAALTPLVFTAIIAAIQIAPRSVPMPSQVNIVRAYEGLRVGPRYNLIYLFDRPYSADFYTRGRAKLAKTTDGVIAAIEQADDPYFAISINRFGILPAALRERLETITSANGTLLLRPRPKA
jgi:4-amino-4-deoxy-L-arabinose transferase-like glycosyltransferase